MELWNIMDIDDSGQQLTITFSYTQKNFKIALVCARCNQLDRLELWESIQFLSSQNNLPWIFGGDFNVILNEEKKLCRLPFTTIEAIDFINCINQSGLLELKFTGSNYTQWNGQIGNECIIKRLDRILMNQQFMDILLSI